MIFRHETDEERRIRYDWEANMWRDRFAWWPTRIDNATIWLERYQTRNAWGYRFARLMGERDPIGELIRSPPYDTGH